MCLIFISLKTHPDYPVIIAANRDEFYQRKTAPASFWSDYPNVLAGRDLEAGGTWMGMSREGKISMITNYRDPNNIDPKAPSRGHLVSDYLVNGEAAEPYLKEVVERAGEYNGFNLIVGDPGELLYFSNYQSKIVRLAEGIHGLSNHLLDTPWPKVERGKNAFRQLTSGGKLVPDKLLDMMYDEHRAKDDELPNTGIGLERERALSSMFIKTPNYGSRSSTVVMINKDGEVAYTERVYDLKTFDYQTQSFQFQVDTSRLSDGFEKK